MLVVERDGCRLLLKVHLGHINLAMVFSTSIGEDSQLYAPCPTTERPPFSETVTSLVMIPPTDAMLMTLEGVYCAALFSRSGASLAQN
jgi:hypothetical protein